MQTRKVTEGRREEGVHRSPFAAPRVWAPLALVILHCALLPSAPAIPAHRLLFLLFFATVVLLPGYLLSTIIAPRTNRAVRALLTLVCGTSITYALLTIIAILHGKLFLLAVAAPCVSVLLLAARHRRTRRAADTGRAPAHLARHIPRSAMLTVAAVSIVVCVLLALGRDPLLYTSDSPDHIAYIRTISRTGEAFPDRFLYPDGGALTRDIRKGLGHAMWGTLNMLTGRVDVLPVWPLISAIGSVSMVLTLFAAGTILFQSAAVGLIAVFLFLLLYNDGLTGYQLITLAYSFPFGKIFYIAFLAFMVRALTSGARVYLALAVTASVAAAGTHINHFILIAFVTAVISATALAYAPPERRRTLVRAVIPVLGAGVIAANLPYLLMRYIRDYAPNNQIHSHVQGVFYITDRLVIVNPLVFYQLGGPLLLLSVVSVFVLWKRHRSSEPARYLSWSLIAVLAVVCNPVLVPLIMERISYLLLRFEFAVPSMLLPAYLIGTLWDGVRSGKPVLTRGRRIVGWIAVLLFAAYPLRTTPERFAYAPERLRAARSRGYRNLSDLYRAIRTQVPAGNVIASDPLTSYSIPAFTDQFVACTYDQHSIPNDSTALERILDHRDIATPGAALTDVLGTLDRYGSEYLVINGRIPAGVMSMYWRPDSIIARRMIERYAARSAYFTPLFRAENTALFAVTDAPRGRIDEERGFEPRYLGPRISPDEAAALTPSGIENIYIRNVTLSERSVHRGDEFNVSIEWVCTRPCEPRSYTVFVRFDTDFEKGALYRDWYGKPYRKALEARRDERYRFTTAHAPVNGIYPPDRWQPFRVVRDEFTVTVPPYAAPGSYRVGVKLLVTTQYPNYAISDFLSNRDVLAGAIVAEVNVE